MKSMIIALIMIFGSAFAQPMVDPGVDMVERLFSERDAKLTEFTKAFYRQDKQYEMHIANFLSLEARLNNLIATFNFPNGETQRSDFFKRLYIVELNNLSNDHRPIPVKLFNLHIGKVFRINLRDQKKHYVNLQTRAMAKK